jgi:undecaprenyl pyrophosphate synthase
MALPRLDVPIYELVIPSTDEKIKFRPFLVKEEKILLIAMESGKSEDMIQSVKDIVDECTFNKLKLGEMPMFDVEYLFLNIRAKSVGEVSKLKVLCQDDMKTYANVEIDLNEVQVEVDGDIHSNKIELTDEMGVIMKYPTIDSFTKNGIKNITAVNMIDVIASCVEQVYDKKGEEVYDSKDSTQAEVIDFVEQLNTTQFQKVQAFFDTMPRLQHTITVKNPKTKVESEVTLTGLNDFFV